MKQETYLPLKWSYRFNLEELLKINEEVPFNDLTKIIGTKYEIIPEEILDSVSVKYPKFTIALLTLVERGSQIFDDKLFAGIFDDIASAGMISEWSRDKQCFVIDKDFVDNLVKTDNINFSKGLFNYLPYKTFFLDFNKNKYLKDNVLMDGAFISVRKIPLSANRIPYPVNIDVSEVSDVWQIHIVRIVNDLYFYDVLAIPDMDMNINAKECDVPKSVKVLKETSLTNKKRDLSVEEKTVNIDGLYYIKTIIQTLCYLSSSEPDIRENEETKRTYKKPDPNTKPKNRFNEIRKQDVGVKIGTIFRNYQKAQKRETKENDSTETKNRHIPHSVKAHWQNYWYKVESGEKVKKPKWKFEYWTGKEYESFDKSKSDVVKHKVR